MDLKLPSTSCLETGKPVERRERQWLFHDSYRVIPPFPRVWGSNDQYRNRWERGKEVQVASFDALLDDDGAMTRTVTKGLVFHDLRSCF